MTIAMQGSWTVAVKSKDAAFPQRFVVAGAATGNGTHAGVTTTPPVAVSGDNWTITVQHNPGGGFIDSTDQIKFPTIVGTQYQFDIQSNDSGADLDFNDLILTCTTPRTQTDFILYGNVTVYSGRCLFNPCFPWWIIIETPLALEEALKTPVLRVPIEKLYPERVVPPVPPPGPGPDPAPFVPLVIPVRDETAIPPKLIQLVKLTRAPQTPVKKAGAAEATDAMVVARTSSVVASTPRKLSFDLDRIGLGRLIDKIPLFCDTDPLAGFGLRFQEYDRTAAELAGGAYTGTGNRETLGTCVTDRNGNYIFRFSRSIAQFIDESNIDVAVGEDEVAQAMPDIIAQLLDPTAPSGIAYESAPYWNVPLLKRINICIPRSLVVRPLAGCQGSRIIQQLGFIRVGIPQTVFDGSGRVTCTDNSEPDIPQTRCAAWGGVVRLMGCFFTDAAHPSAVTQYTVRHRHPTSGGWSSWEFYQEPLRLGRVGFLNPQQTGPFDRMLEIVNGAPLQAAKAYDNIELLSAWRMSDWPVKAVIDTTNGTPLYAPAPGPVEFQIQGYDAAGQQVAGKTDSITLYIDNVAPVFHINSVNMGSQTGGDCALFSLTGEPLPAVLNVRFKAIHEGGFLHAYGLSVRKGNMPGNFPIATTTGPMGEASGALGQTYSHGSAAPCNALVGTRPPGEPMADASDFVRAFVIPSAGNWLTPAQPFCTFAVQLSCSKRVTDGRSGYPVSYGTIEYLLGIQQ
jgi:hypothetical protein